MNSNYLNNTPIIDPERFLDYINECQIKNILIGNGFCLSHPVLKLAFKWDTSDAFQEALKFEKRKTDCPETDLGKIRRALLEKILRYYISNLAKSLGLDQNTCSLPELYQIYKYIKCNRLLFSAPISSICNIFTLNYDPIFYFEFLKNSEKTGKKFIFDGFIASNDPGLDDCLSQHYQGVSPNNDFLKQKYVTCKLENSNQTKLLYLHGSWFIQAQRSVADPMIRKLSFGSKSPGTIDSIFSGEGLPHVILEDRPHVKKALLEKEDNPYLNYCYSQLKKIEGSLLIFGCSFNKDDHIVQAIAKNLKEGNLKTVHICYLNESDKESIQKKFSKVENKIIWVQVSENVIWQEVNLPTNFESSGNQLPF